MQAKLSDAKHSCVHRPRVSLDVGISVIAVRQLSSIYGHDQTLRMDAMTELSADREVPSKLYSYYGHNRESNNASRYVRRRARRRVWIRHHSYLSRGTRQIREAKGENSTCLAEHTNCSLPIRQNKESPGNDINLAIYQETHCRPA